MHKIDKPGIYLGFDELAYHADPCPAPSLTQSVAKIIVEHSPGHARLEHPRLAPPVAADDEIEKYVAAQAIGNAAHKLMLGRGREIAEANFDSFQSKAAKAFREENESAGLLVVKAKDLTRAVEMVRAARRQLQDAGHGDAFNEGHAETVVAWQEDELWLRSLIDWHANLAKPYDYKTTGMSCAPHVVEECAADRGWDIQAAMHERGLDTLDPDNAGRRRHHYVAQENWAPYALSVVEISEADLTMGRKKLAYAVETWGQCISSGKWPLYLPETIRSRPRGYQESKWLARESDHAEHRAMPTNSRHADNIAAG